MDSALTFAAGAATAALAMHTCAAGGAGAAAASPTATLALPEQLSNPDASDMDNPDDPLRTHASNPLFSLFHAIPATSPLT